jgi:hypothetical protein
MALIEWYDGFVVYRKKGSQSSAEKVPSNLIECNPPVKL